MKRIIVDLPVESIEQARSFYTEFLGLEIEEFNLGWVARYSSSENDAQVQLVSSDAAAGYNPVASVQVDDIDGAYDEALQGGHEILYPITTEPWGVRRFFVRAPDGNILNIVRHRD